MVDGSNAATFPQYGFAMAGQYPDPTQWSNPYSSFNSPGQMPGWPTGYVGSPVNAATGQPIGQPAGTTLNSNPAAQPQPGAVSNPWANVQQQQQAGMNAPGSTQRGGLGTQDWGNLTPAQRADAYTSGGLGSYQTGLGMMPSGGNLGSPQAQTALGFMNQGLGNFNNFAGGQQSQAAPGVQPASNSSNYQSALSALSNPGNPITPGASFNPATQTGGGAQSQGVLNNFLQNWKGGGVGQGFTPGIGGGSSGVAFGANNPFFAALGGQK